MVPKVIQDRHDENIVTSVLWPPGAAVSTAPGLVGRSCRTDTEPSGAALPLGGVEAKV